MEYTKYEDSKGAIVFARQGLSNPVNENEPFLDGYWILLDTNGSVQFVPRKEFEQEYKEVN